jgi:hypothetical protein
MIGVTIVTSSPSENGGLVIAILKLPNWRTVAPLLLISTEPVPVTLLASDTSLIMFDS